MDALENLFANLARAKRELSIAYTFILGARGYKDRKVVSTDLVKRELQFTKDG